MKEILSAFLSASHTRVCGMSTHDAEEKRFTCFELVVLQKVS